MTTSTVLADQSPSGIDTTLSALYDDVFTATTTRGQLQRQQAQIASFITKAATGVLGNSSCHLADVVPPRHS